MNNWDLLFAEKFSARRAASDMGVTVRVALAELDDAAERARLRKVDALTQFSRIVQNDVYDALIRENGGSMCRPVLDNRLDRTFGF